MNQLQNKENQMNGKTKLFCLGMAFFCVTAFTGCFKSGESAGSSSRTKASEKIDMTAFALSIASPLPAEDAAVDYTAKSNNPKKIIWRHGVVNRNMDETPPQRAERQFFIEMKKRLGDKIEIQLYTGGTLGTSADQILGGLQARSFESYGYNVGAFAEYTNAFLPLDVLYLIPNIEAGIKVCAEEPGEIMRQKCIADTGLNVLVYDTIGMRHITNSKRPIHTPKDLKGLKIRVQNNPLHILGMTALGASPTPIAYAELFTSLQQKVVDGQENPIANIFDMNYGEVQTYMTLTNHMYTAGALVSNNVWLQEQSPEFRKAVEESRIAANEYTAKETILVENRLLEEMSKKMEITYLTAEGLKEFQNLSQKTWDQAAKRIGPEYFNRVKMSIEKVLAPPAVSP
jgi:C4-dicarboxylate-binding protein DctP